MPPHLTSPETSRSAQTARWLRWPPPDWGLGKCLAGQIHLIRPVAVAAGPARLKPRAQLHRLATVMRRKS